MRLLQYRENNAVTISGSTYVAPVTGVTIEGPAANFTGNVINATSNGWLLGTSIGNANKLMDNGERDMGANIIMLCFGCGVLLGATVSFGTVAFLDLDFLQFS